MAESGTGTGANLCIPIRGTHRPREASTASGVKGRESASVMYNEESTKEECSCWGTQTARSGAAHCDAVSQVLVPRPFPPAGGVPVG